LVVLIQQLCRPGQNNRLILFSQFTAFLEKVKSALDSLDIKYVLCQGNVMRRNKALRSFYSSEDVKVILLSLESAASGTNLIEATHVVLLDPVSASKEEVDAIEAQAIGRAYRQGQKKKITVVRLLTRDTVEHALFLRHHPPKPVAESAALSRAPSALNAADVIRLLTSAEAGGAAVGGAATSAAQKQFEEGFSKTLGIPRSALASADDNIVGLDKT